MSLDEGLDPSVTRRPGPLPAVSQPQPVAASDVSPSEPRPWRLLAPDEAVVLAPHGRREVRGLPSGTPVVLLVDGFLARVRARRVAARIGIVVDRELISVPSTRQPLVVLDIDDAAIAVLWTAVAMVPPGLTRALAPITLLLRAMAVAPPSLTRRLAPGRILIGHTR